MQGFRDYIQLHHVHDVNLVLDAHLLVPEATGRGRRGRGQGATGQWGEAIRLLNSPWKVEGEGAGGKVPSSREMEGLLENQSRPGTVWGAESG